MKKVMCLMAMALVLSTSAPSTFAGDPPILVGGGGRVAAQAQTPQKPLDKFQIFANEFKVRGVVMLVQMGVL